MKTKFTPGKWTSKYFTESTTLIKAENHTKAIAEVRGTNIKANAALIAAAPDMFEALENALSALVQVSDLESGTNGPIYKAMTTCREALNKARGE